MFNPLRKKTNATDQLELPPANPRRNKTVHALGRRVQTEIGKPNQGQGRLTEDMVAASGGNEGTGAAAAASRNDSSDDGPRHSVSVSVIAEGDGGIVVGGMARDFAGGGGAGGTELTGGGDGDLPSPLPIASGTDSAGDDSTMQGALSRRGEEGGRGGSVSGSERAEQQQRARKRFRGSRPKDAARKSKGASSDGGDDDDEGNSSLSPPPSPTLSARGGGGRGGEGAGGGVGLVGGGVRRTEGGGSVEAARNDDAVEGSSMLSPVSISSSVAVSDSPSAAPNERVEGADKARRRSGRGDTEEGSVGRRVRPPRLDV